MDIANKLFFVSTDCHVLWAIYRLHNFDFKKTLFLLYYNLVYSRILYGSGSQTIGRDPLVRRGRNFSGSRKSFKIQITACFVSNNLKVN